MRFWKLFLMRWGRQYFARLFQYLEKTRKFSCFLSCFWLRRRCKLPHFTQEQLPLVIDIMWGLWKEQTCNSISLWNIGSNSCYCFHRMENLINHSQLSDKNFSIVQKILNLGKTVQDNPRCAKILAGKLGFQALARYCGVKIQLKSICNGKNCHGSNFKTQLGQSNSWNLWKN